MNPLRPTSPAVRLLLPVAALALGLSLAGCGSDSTAAESPAGASGSTSPSDSSDPSGPSESTGATLTVTDPWVKAVDSGMTAIFGTLRNEGDSAVTVVSATTTASTMVQLHETVTKADGSSTMQEKKGGFEIPAGGSHELAPGGDHIMLMDVAAPLKPGDSISATLTLGDGSTVDFEALVKDFSGANEKYDDGMAGMSSPGSDE